MLVNVFNLKRFPSCWIVFADISNFCIWGLNEIDKLPDHVPQARPGALCCLPQMCLELGERLSIGLGSGDRHNALSLAWSASAGRSASSLMRLPSLLEQRDA
jgi:hypothetical protein